MKRILKPATISTIPKPHFSLALPHYSQATSPIRRYLDLVAQYQIVRHLENIPYIKRDIISDVINEVLPTINNSNQIMRQDQTNWRLLWLATQKQKTWRAIFLQWLNKKTCLGLVRIYDIALDVASTIIIKQGIEEGAALELSVSTLGDMADIPTITSIPID